jgi:hypothetical protein
MCTNFVTLQDLGMGNIKMEAYNLRRDRKGIQTKQKTNKLRGP